MGNTQSPPPIPIRLRKLRSVRHVHSRRRCLLKFFRPNISLEYHFGIAILIKIANPTNHVVTLLTSFPTLLRTTVFCPPYLLIGSSLVQSSSLFSFHNELNYFASCFTDNFIALQYRLYRYLAFQNFFGRLLVVKP